MSEWSRVSGTVVEGHGVASGRGRDPRFPDGTLELQLPIFKEHGIDLESYYPATLNVSIDPYHYTIRKAKWTLREVKWTDHFPPEDFSFFDCRVMPSSGDLHQGLVYYPHPETKPDHFQSSDVLEIITSFIPDLRYGDEVTVELRKEQMTVEKRG